jgi:hypothetical protein
MTTAQNVVLSENRNRFPKALPVTSDQTINQGDFVYWDGTNYSVTPLTNKSQLNGTNFLGVAMQSNQVAVFGGDAASPGIEVEARAPVEMNTTAGDTYLPFDRVTVGADSQTITNTGVGSNQTIGYVVIEAPATARPHQATPAPEFVTGGPGVRIRVILAPNHVAAAAL